MITTIAIHMITIIIIIIYTIELGEVSPLSWFTLVILVCINWFRAVVVDPDAQRPR